MINFDVNNQESIAIFILKNLPRHEVMALGTVGSDGLPWVVCVNLSYDSELNITWKSALSAEHSKNIAHNKHVSICIFSHSSEAGDFGFYCKAEAHEVSEKDELAKLLQVKYVQKGLPLPPTSDFLGDSTRRLYCAKITEAWVNDDNHIKTPVNLTLLKSLAHSIINL